MDDMVQVQEKGGVLGAVNTILNDIYINNIGRTAFCILAVLLAYAAENGWQREIIINNQEMKKKSGIKCDATLWRNRKTLEAYQLIEYRKSEQGASGTGTYILNLEKLKVDGVRMEPISGALNKAVNKDINKV